MTNFKMFLDCLWLRCIKHFIIIIIASIVISGLAIFAVWKMPHIDLAKGIFWQPNRECLQPEGIWNQIGIHTLVVQWTVTDGRAWIPIKKIPQWEPTINWADIRNAPWAKKTIIGLAGDFQVPRSRINAKKLAALSQEIITSIPIKNPIAWYAPVEISPGWHNIQAIHNYLTALPRPLWVTIYGGNEMTPKTLVSWVRTWLPSGVGILYQDGVGVGHETPVQAARRVRALEAAFGKAHVGIILEAFQQDSHGRFVSASVWRVANQLRTYKGLNVYIFSVKTLGIIDVLMLKILGLFGFA